MGPTSIKWVTSILVGLSDTVTFLSRKNKLSVKNGLQNTPTVNLSFLHKWCIALHTLCCKGMINYSQFYTVKYLSHIWKATWLIIHANLGLFYLWANIADLNPAAGFYYTLLKAIYSDSALQLKQALNIAWLQFWLISMFLTLHHSLTTCLQKIQNKLHWRHYRFFASLFHASFDRKAMKLYPKPALHFQSQDLQISTFCVQFVKMPVVKVFSFCSL